MHALDQHCRPYTAFKKLQTSSNTQTCTVGLINFHDIKKETAQCCTSACSALINTDRCSRYSNHSWSLYLPTPPTRCAGGLPASHASCHPRQTRIQPTRGEARPPTRQLIDRTVQNAGHHKSRLSVDTSAVRAAAGSADKLAIDGNR